MARSFQSKTTQQRTTHPSRTTHRGRLLTVEVLSFTDSAGRDAEREVVHHPGAVVVVPLLDGDRLVLIRNRRIAVNADLWELPAGTLEADEDPQHAAARELQEETGYHPATVQPLGSFFTSPGFLDEQIHAFVARDLSFVGQSLDPGEEITASVLDRTEVLVMIDDGRIRDGKTIASVLMWDRVDRAKPDARELLVERVQHLVDRLALRLHHWFLIGVRAQRSRNANSHCVSRTSLRQPGSHRSGSAYSTE